MKTAKSLFKIHEDVPADHYDQGIKRNLLQKYWHLRRFTEVLRVVEPSQGPILDVGCHSGTFTKVLRSKLKAKNIYGIDVSSSAIALAKKRLPYGNFQVADAAKLPFQNNFFQDVFCLEVLEHIDDPISAVEEINRVLKKKGKLYILVPSDNKLFRMVWLLWTFYYPHWRHAHVQSYNNDVLEKILTQIGFKLLAVKTFNLGMLKLIVCKK